MAQLCVPFVTHSIFLILLKSPILFPKSSEKNHFLNKNGMAQRMLVGYQRELYVKSIRNRFRNNQFLYVHYGRWGSGCVGKF